MTTRRELLVAIGASAFTVPFGSFAQQQGKVWRVGYISPSLQPGGPGAFRQGMRELGYVEGKNLVIDLRSADGNYERLAGLVTELVQLKVDVIVAAGTAAIEAAQKVTTTIPIVMGNTVNPVASGFVKSLARPGGNITGLSNMTGEVSPKYLELMLGMVPKLSSVAVLMNPDNSGHAEILKNLAIAAQRAHVNILPLHARNLQEINNAFSTMRQKKVGAVIVFRDPFLINEQGRQIAILAEKNRLPSISGRREYVEAGGLMSYGPSIQNNLRHAAAYVDKIFKGANPGDLPVEQPTTLELFINRKTAKALRLIIPQSLLISADKVIE